MTNPNLLILDTMISEEETVLSIKREEGEMLLVVDIDGDVMVSFCSNTHPSLGWRKHYQHPNVNLKEVIDLFVSKP